MKTRTALKTMVLLITFNILLASCSTTTPLEGKWTCLFATVNGKPLPAKTTSQLQLTLTKKRYKTEKGSEVLFDSTYSIDSSRDPRQITMIGTEGELTGKEALGIYLVRDVTLQVCYTMPGKPRPTAFASSPGSEAYLITWQRRKE